MVHYLNIYCCNLIPRELIVIHRDSNFTILPLVTTMESYEYNFPIDLWRQVLVNNSYGDLCNVVLTSRHMNGVGSLPKLWAGMKVCRRKVMENGLAELYNIKRFKKVQINISRMWELEYEDLKFERLMKEIFESPLENVNLSSNNLSGVSAELLASAVSNLHIVNLGRTDLTTDQCVALLKASLSSTTLIKLDLEIVNLSKVPCELLASSISGLQDVNLCAADLTTNQCVSLLDGSLSSTTLRNLNLDYVNLSEVPADLLANSISRLQGVKLRATGLTTDQCVSVLTAIHSSTTLRNVDLRFNGNTYIITSLPEQVTVQL